MSNEIIGDVIICLMVVSVFVGSICLLDFIAEHIIPESVMNKIMTTLFGELPDD